MGRIIVDNLEIYSYHGCFAEEREIGSDYKLTIWVEGDFSSAEKSDNLNDTVSLISETLTDEETKKLIGVRG